MPLPLGELAALGTAACWTVSSLAFSAAGRRMGSLSLNLIRLSMAFLLVTAYCGVRRGMFLPLDASARTWGWLFASGFAGFVFGDLCLFRAFVLVGPRLSMLVMALAPPITAVLGFFLLNERISPLGIAGMLVTVAGIAWVVRERPDTTSNEAVTGRNLQRGVLLAFGGAIGQALGMVLSKIGMEKYDPVASGQIRIIAGVLGFAVVLTAVGWWKKTAEAIRNGPALRYAAIGSVMGPFAGVSLSLVAVQLTETGVAATMMSTTPVLIIPVVILTGQERVSARAAIGAIVAVAGVAMLWVR
jgi:drug/metabolite transporter (DMT)-like permease